MVTSINTRFKLCQGNLIVLLQKDKILCLVLLLGQTIGFPGLHKKEASVSKEQSVVASSKNARYYFSADIDDDISNVTLHRKELRTGADVVGSFAYSDGFVYREVIYTADERGYRIISDKMEQIPRLPKEEKNTKSSNASTLNTASTFKSFNPPLRRLLHSNRTKF